MFGVCISERYTIAMNKICIFGADGRTGIEVVKKAVSSGYSVTAFIYNKDMADHFDKSVTVIQGNILNEQQVINAVQGADTVISVVGHIKNSDPLMQTKGINNVISAMKEHSITRIISLTGTGVRIPGDTPSVIDRILNFIIKKIDPERINDGKEHVEALQASELNWTILRVLKLSSAPYDGNYTLTKHGPVELSTSRKKVADIMVDLATSKEFVADMPVSS